MSGISPAPIVGDRSPRGSAKAVKAWLAAIFGDLATAREGERTEGIAEQQPRIRPRRFAR
jgi:hypothetical protein